MESENFFARRQWAQELFCSLKHPNHYLYVVFLLALIFTSVYNLALWRHVYSIIKNSENLPFLFAALFPVALVMLFFAIFLLLFSYRVLIKPLFVLLFLTCSLANYASFAYKIIFDGSMISTILETNPAEASSYLSVSSIACFIILGVIPSVMLLKLKIYYPSLGISLVQRTGAIAAALAAAALCIFPFYQQYSFIGRANRNLNREILPMSYLYSAANHVKSRYFDAAAPYVAMGEDLKLVGKTDKPKLLFLVIGETARAQSYEASGYGRPTNQYTQREKTIDFANVSSCGTATSHSVPCMFSNLTREGFSEKLAENREGILDLLKKAGINITWLDNDAGCKGVCDRVRSIQISPVDSRYCNGQTCRDEVFVDYAKSLTENLTGDTIIVFHLIGSHGPRYYERYPKRFRLFTPDCNRPDVENCTLEEVRNAYDNTIAYTDYVIYTLIEDVLEKHLDDAYPMLLYISDHGESTGESGIFLHAMPYDIAPKEQTRVPMQLWMPKVTAGALNLNRECLVYKARNESLSHDNFFHSLMSLMQVTSAEHQPKLDIFDDCIAQD